jgi:succinate-semialdehyde dehydrogenase/glutarate-semialdehyde dehydrogenase
MVQGVEIKDGIIQNIDPATGELIEPFVAATTPSELAHVIQKANEAQLNWSDVPLSERIALLRKAMANVGNFSDELRETITKEMGKVVSEAKLEVDNAVALKDGWLDLIEEANQDVHLGSGKEGEPESIIVRDAFGVVAVLSPWNFPVGEIPLLVLPALAAGNAVIVKPSEVTPLCGALICKAIAEVLPDGVLQVVQGDGAVGEQLVTSDDIHMVAMTGSSATGKKIMEKCAKNLKRVVLELGGKDPMIVFADADLDKAANDAVTNSLFNAGQVCCSVERVYVEESVKPQFEQKVIGLAKAWKVGNPTDDSVKMGPMVSKTQMAIVKEQVAKAVDSGASLLYESEVPEVGGNFYPITVLSDLTQDMTIQNNETFGPVVSIAAFDGSEKEAVRLSNDTEYGLASYVYTCDLQKGARVGRKIRSGQVGINCYSLVCAQAKCPWVGHKGSGMGSHSGMDGFRSFSGKMRQYTFASLSILLQGRLGN